MDLFDQTVAATTIDDSKDFLSELVGSDKKFKDVKELAKGKAFSDAHIVTLEQTLSRMREELQTRKTAEELINQINLTKRNVDPQANPDNQDPTDQTLTKSGLSPEDVERILQERDTKRRREDNLNLASQKLRETHGEQAAVALQRKAAELGLDTQYLKNMAQEAPSAFLALFSKPTETTQPDIFNAPPTSTYRPPTTNTLQEKWSDFNKVKITDSKTYWSPAFQRKVAEAAQRATNAGRSEEFYNS